MTLKRDLGLLPQRDSQRGEEAMTKTTVKRSNDNSKIDGAVHGARQVLDEPILKMLLRGSALTSAQLETLLIDLIAEDTSGMHISYEDKAKARVRKHGSPAGVSRGAFNRTLAQARRNVTRSVYTLLLLAYLGFFDQSPFRSVEQIASKIGDYRRIREILAGREELLPEDIESYRATERSVLAALEQLSAPLALKSEQSRREKKERPLTQ